jgi:anti-sigma-K factor RskA
VNIGEYISSGIIESYVLGLASAEERAGFEMLCRQHPELVAARNDFEVALENQLLSESIAPGAGMKERIMQRIRQDIPAGQSKIVSMENTDSTPRSGWRYAAAVAVILLLAAAYFAYNFYSKNKELKQELAKSKDTQTEMNARLKNLEIVMQPNVAVVSLKGTEKAPTASANIYWDSTSADVYLLVKNMPKLPSDKQYQLWSIINGKDGGLQPTSLGLFDMGEDGKVILKMEGAKKADAFAITIESRGNKGGPTLEQLQSMGKTSL